MVTAEGGMTCLSRQTAGAGGYCRRGYDLPVKGDSRRWWLLQKGGGMTCLSRQTAGAGGYCRRGYDLPVEGDGRRWWLLQKGV